MTQYLAAIHHSENCDPAAESEAMAGEISVID